MTTERGDNRNQMLIERPSEGLHQLKNKWAFWSLKYDVSKEWNDCLKKIAVIETVEDFWNLYLQILSVSELPPFSDYYLFKEGIQPKWEDLENVKGGRWVVSISKQKRDHDKIWLKLMMLLICEEFGNYGEFICGAVFNSRRTMNKIALWTSDASLDELNRQIGLIYSNSLELHSESLHYEPHQAASDRSKPKEVVSESHVEDQVMNEVPLHAEILLQAEGVMKEVPLPIEDQVMNDVPLQSEEVKDEGQLPIQNQIKDEVSLPIEDQLMNESLLKNEDQLQAEIPIKTDDQLKEEDQTMNESPLKAEIPIKTEN